MIPAHLQIPGVTEPWMVDRAEFKKVRRFAKQIRDSIAGGMSSAQVLESLGVGQAEAARMKYCWPLWARGPDLTPTHNPQIEQLLRYQRWSRLLVLSGRAFGKSLFGAQWVRYQIESGNMRQIALIARTPADARRVMIEGRSGLLNITPPWFKPVWEPSKNKLTWPNGACAWVYSSEKPDQLRGPEHDGYWADELAAWRFLEETWNNLLMGFRLAPADMRPRGIITTTPRPLPLIREMVQEAQALKCQGKTYLIQTSTFENAANLPPEYLQEMIEKYRGTRLGDQELYAKILDDSPGALWCHDDIQRIGDLDGIEMTRVVVAVDPQKASQGVGHRRASEHKTNNKNAPNCSTGIIGCGRDSKGNGYVLEDRTMDGKPDEWARAVCSLYHELDADCVVAESNAGGDMVEAVIRACDPNIPIKLVHASRGKATRAEPISALYKRKKIWHYGFEELALLEDQMCTWDPNASESPDRVDALVWGFTDLLLGENSFGLDGGDLMGYGSTRGWQRNNPTGRRW